MPLRSGAHAGSGSDARRAPPVFQPETWLSSRSATAGGGPAAGVYGTNFDHLPELHWRYGYLYFWGMALLVVLALLWGLRRARLL